jgi:LPS-assembly protein
MRRGNLRLLVAGGWSQVVALAAAGTLLSGAGPVPGALSDLRVRSEPTETVVEARTGLAVPVEDRTRGILASARDREAPQEPEAPAEEAVTAPRAGEMPPGDAVGPGQLISTGRTFAEEIRLYLPATSPTRAASVIVGDPLVSEVRVLRETVGSSLVIFVRQPVLYEVRRAAGGTRLRVRIRPDPTAAGIRARRAVIPGRGGEREVTVDAETIRYDRQKNVIHASGGVAITRPGTAVTAEDVLVNQATYDAEAHGNVVVRTEGTVVRGEHVQLNLDDETGWIEQGEVELPTTGYLLSGEQLSKGFGQTYRVERGILTTCRCGGLEPPSWSIAAQRVDVDLLGRGTARHLTFRVRDVPVLYLPFGVLPINRTRQSGFLMPRFGQSIGSDNQRGFQYEQPFYWAITKSSDATIAFDIETAARVGGIGEYRYALNRHSDGRVAATYFNESLRIDDATFENADVAVQPPENRWAVFTDMRHRLPGNVRAYADTMLVSDDLFFREIDSASFQPAEDVAARTSTYTATRVGALKTWEQASLWGEATFYQDLEFTQENEDDGTLQRLPRVELRVRRTLLGDRVGLSLTGEGIDYQRQTGFDGLRLDLHPEIRVPFQVGRVVFGSLEAGVRGTLYELTNTDRIGQCRGGDRDGKSCTDDSGCPRGGQCKVNFRCRGGEKDGDSCTADSQCSGGGRCVIRPTGKLGDRHQTREIAHVGWRIGTKISRVFPFERWGFSKLKHTIEPTVTYSFIPVVGGQDELPLFDGVDRINRRSLFSYGVVSRLIARLGSGAGDEITEDESLPSAPPVRELARISLLQVYDTQREIAGGQVVDGERVPDDHVSDVDLGLRLSPGRLLALRYGATYNVRQNTLKGSSLSFLMREPWQAETPQLASLQSPTSLAISYRFVRDGASADAGPGSEEFDGSLYLRLARFFGLRVETRINLLENEVRETAVGARFISRCDCWMVEVGVEDRADPEETVFRAQLTLAGIGSVGRAAGGEFVTVPGFARERYWP